MLNDLLRIMFHGFSAVKNFHFKKRQASNGSPYIIGNQPLREAAF